MQINPKIVKGTLIFIGMLVLVALLAISLHIVILQKRVINLEARPAVREVKTVIVTPTVVPTVNKRIEKVTLPVASHSAR